MMLTKVQQDLMDTIHRKEVNNVIAIIDRLAALNSNYIFQDDNDNTPLHLACQQNLQDVVAALLKNDITNAAMAIQNIQGENPLHIACRGTQEVDVKPSNNNNNNGILIEEEEQLLTEVNLENNLAPSIALLLVKEFKTMDIRTITSIMCQQNKKGETPLLLACQYQGSHLGLIKKLLKFISKSNCLQLFDNKGYLPIHWAFAKGSVDVALALAHAYTPSMQQLIISSSAQKSLGLSVAVTKVAATAPAAFLEHSLNQGPSGFVVGMVGLLLVVPVSAVVAATSGAVALGFWATQSQETSLSVIIRHNTLEFLLGFCEGVDPVSLKTLLDQNNLKQVEQWINNRKQEDSEYISYDQFKKFIGQEILLEDIFNYFIEKYHEDPATFSNPAKNNGARLADMSYLLSKITAYMKENPEVDYKKITLAEICGEYLQSNEANKQGDTISNTKNSFHSQQRYLNIYRPAFLRLTLDVFARRFPLLYTMPRQDYNGVREVMTALHNAATKGNAGFEQYQSYLDKIPLPEKKEGCYIS